MHISTVRHRSLGAAAATMLVALVLSMLLPPGATADASPSSEVDIPIPRVPDNTAATLAATTGPGPDMDAALSAAPQLRAARNTPFQPEASTMSLASQPTLGQQYHDTCGDTPVGDLALLTALDDGPSVAWRWDTCIDAPFRGTEAELVLFLVDGTPWTATPTADLVLAQFMDGFVLLYRTLGSDHIDDWVLIAEGFGQVSHDEGGGIGAGRFLLDAFDLDFPTEYRFEVGSLVDEGIADELPKPGHPVPTFPTECTLLFADRMEVLVAPDHASDVRRELEADGVTVSSASPRLGLLVLEHDDTARVAGLAQDPRVRSVEPVTGRPATDVGEQELALASTIDSTWPIDQLRLPAAWERMPGFRTEVAVIDSGVDPTRAGFTDRVGAGFDAVAGERVPAGRSTAMGAHGTGVAALVAAQQDGAVRGANPGAVLRPVLLNSHDGCITSERVARAIEATLDMPDARIVNLSFGGPQLTAAEALAIERAVAAGKVLVAATGNTGELLPDQPLYPAAHPDVIGVGASTVDRLVAPFSQQAAVDVLAPGAEVTTYDDFDTVIAADGTSLSAPYVSGALSLWLAANPVASAANARAALVAAADPVAFSVGGGAGILDVDRLLENAGLPDGAASDGDTPDDVPLPGFADVDPNSTHGAAIVAIAAAGVTSGYPDGTYRPSEHISRGQMATFLAGAFDLDVVAAPDPGLTDVAPESTHGPAIAAVIEAGIAGGYPDDTFRPGQDVTRGHMATFLAGAMGLPLDGAGDRFPDAEGTTHAVAIEAIADAQVTSGYPDGTFRPNDPVTRAQMATFLAAAMGLG